MVNELPSEFGRLLYELNQSMLQTLHTVSYDIFADVRSLITHLHDQNQKLEARIAELERMHSFSDNISVANDLFKRAAKADRDLRYANAKATVNKILGKEEPIEGMVERAITHDMEVVFSGKPVEELTESQKELRKLLLKTWIPTSRELVDHIPNNLQQP